MWKILRNTHTHTQNLLKLINQQLCRIQNQHTKNNLYLYTQAKDIKKTIPFTKTSKRIKYLGKCNQGGVRLIH